VNYHGNRNKTGPRTPLLYRQTFYIAHDTVHACNKCEIILAEPSQQHL